MKASLEKAGLSLRAKRVIWWLGICIPLYLLSTGPVAWATNDGLHPAYLPGWVNWIYLPLFPFLKMGWIGQAFYFYTAVIWGGFPAGYTTL
ncbi:MAG: hypothetical protein ABSG78_25315 [Verrucomicrobiota bacterium]|jgi:hypothetical protein